MKPTLEVIKIETTQMLAASTMTLQRLNDPYIDDSGDILAPSFDFED